jgi:predicted DNA-binding transcriptional regulator AlpA
MPTQPDELLTTEQAAAKLHMKANTLAVWRHDKRYPLKYIKIGSKVLYRESEIERFLEAGTKGGEPAPASKRARPQ